jgi:hypothetical protein
VTVEHKEVSAETTLGILIKRAVKGELPSRLLFKELLRVNSEPGGNLELDLQLWRELGYLRKGV